MQRAKSSVYIYIYTYIPGDPKSKLAGEKRFNERRKPSPPLFGNKDDERRVEKVRIKGMLILLRRKFFFFFYIYIYIFETKINREVTFTNFRNLWERIRGIEFIARLLRYNVDETKDILEVVRASWHRVRVCDDSSRFRDNGHARAGFSYAN